MRVRAMGRLSRVGRRIRCATFILFCLGIVGGIACTKPLAKVVRSDRLKLAQIRRVAVLPLENLTDNPAAADTLADMFTTSLYRVGRFEVMERAEVLRRLQDQKIALPKVIDRTVARELGAALGVDAVFYGTVTEYGYLFYPDEAVVGARFRLVVVDGGEVIWAGVINRSTRGLLQPSDEPLSLIAQMGASDLAAELVLPKR